MNDELTYAITIYAVLPTIVIVLLFSFLTDLDRQVAQYESMLLNNRNKLTKENSDFIKKKLRGVDKFIIVSSRYLHVTMSFYLIFLLGSFSIEIFNFSKLVIISITLISYFLYVTFYTYHESTTIDNIELEYKWFYYLIHFFSFFFVPIIFLFIFNDTSIKSFYIIWITMNILQIALWWLIFPVKDKPLSNLNSVSKEILNISVLPLLKSNIIELDNIFILRKEIELNLSDNWSIFRKSVAYNELKEIHSLLEKSKVYLREDRCKNVPYPPYHIGAQIIGKNVNEILAKYNYVSYSIFPGKIEDSIEFEMKNGNSIRRFFMKIKNQKNEIFKLYIEFEHLHNKYDFCSEPKVFIQ